MPAFPNSLIKKSLYRVRKLNTAKSKKPIPRKSLIIKMNPACSAFLVFFFKRDSKGRSERSLHGQRSARR